jgi:hypothetical protein
MAAMFTKQVIQFIWITLDGGKVPWYMWTISSVMCALWLIISAKRIKNYKNKIDEQV